MNNIIKLKATVNHPIDKLIVKIKQKTYHWGILNTNYEISNYYWIIEDEDGLITVVLKRQSNKKISEAEQFNTILAEVNKDSMSYGSTNELWWEDSLRLLYHHYPYSVDNNSNSFLIDWSKNVIAVQWNGAESNRYIQSSGTKAKEYVVVNNKWKLEGQYKKGCTQLLNILENS